jgi:hypothetical protein
MRRRLLLAIGAATVAIAANAQTPAFLIFGGDDHKVFLGCLNCAETDPSSVWNDMSRYGWGNGFGVWNAYGPYKNPYGGQSACSEYAADPPVIVDKQGNSYGYLTTNQYKPGSVCGAQGAQRICTALKVMCAQ